MEAAVTDEQVTDKQVTDDAAMAEELDRIEGDLAGVEASMARLDDQTYGTCTVCTARLDDDLLRADPTIRACPAHR